MNRLLQAMTRWQVADLAGAALLAFVVSIPLEKVVQVQGVGTIAQVLGLLAAGLAGLVALQRGGLSRPLDDVHLLLLAYTGWAGLSLMWTIDEALTLERIITTLQLAVMVVLLWEIRGGARALRGTVAAFTLGCAVAAGLTVADAISSQGGQRFTAPGTNPNDTAFLLTLAIPMAWQLGLTARGAARRVGWWVLIVLFLLAVGLTASRSALLIGVVALAVIPMSAGGLGVRGRAWLGVGVVLAAGAGALLAPDVLPERSLERLATIDEEIAVGDLNDRVDLWTIGLDITAEEPLLGVGAGASRHVVGDIVGIPNGVHNTFLSLAADLGPLGLLPWLLVLLTLGRRLARRPPLDKGVGLILMATLVIGVMPRHWEHRKGTWLVLAVLLELAASGWADARRPAAQDEVAPDGLAVIGGSRSSKAPSGTSAPMMTE